MLISGRKQDNTAASSFWWELEALDLAGGDPGLLYMSMVHADITILQKQHYLHFSPPFRVQNK